MYHDNNQLLALDQINRPRCYLSLIILDFLEFMKPKSFGLMFILSFWLSLENIIKRMKTLFIFKYNIIYQWKWIKFPTARRIFFSNRFVSFIKSFRTFFLSLSGWSIYYYIYLFLFQRKIHHSLNNFIVIHKIISIHKLRGLK